MNQITTTAPQTPQYNPKGRSFSGWLGEKSLLAHTIIESMPEHTTYLEVFGGAGWVLFKKTPSFVEVINDINDDLINLYRVLKFHFEAFLDEFEFLLMSRTVFNDFKKMDTRGLTDLLRAARFYFFTSCLFCLSVGRKFQVLTGA